MGSRPAAPSTATRSPNLLRARTYRLGSRGFLCDAVSDPWNRRLKLLGVDAGRFPHFDERLRVLHAPATERTFTKFTVYAPAGDEALWNAHGFRKEAAIRGFFADGGDAELWARYADHARAMDPRRDEQDRTVALARTKAPGSPSLPAGMRLRVAEEKDAARVGGLLRAVFEDYPTPLDDVVIHENIVTGRSRFHLVEREEDGALLACASAELDVPRSNAEITDCATRPEARGRGLMVRLIRSFEEALPVEAGIVDLYTIARADEVGMNCAFARAGYVYTGRLVNNCRMPGGWESMNVWCRRAGEPAAAATDRP